MTYTFRQIENILRRGIVYLGEYNDYYECSADTKVPDLMLDDREVWCTIYIYRAQIPGKKEKYDQNDRPMDFCVYTMSTTRFDGKLQPQEQIRFISTPADNGISDKHEIQAEMLGKWIDTIIESTEYDYDAEIDEKVIPNDNIRNIVLKTIEWIESVVNRYESPVMK